VVATRNFGEKRLKTTKLELRWGASGWTSSERAPGPTTRPCESTATWSLRGRCMEEFAVAAVLARHNPITWTVLIVVYACTRRTAGSRSRSSSTPRWYHPGAGRTMVPSSVDLLFVCRYIGLEDTMRLTSSTCRPALASHPSGRPRPATRLHDRRRSAQTEYNLLGACWTQQNTEVVEQAAKMVRLVMPTYSRARSCGARLPCQD
jgi:hypothetical protein